MKTVLSMLVLSASLFAGQITAHIAIEGMTCPLCTTAIKKSLKSVEGVETVKVRLNTEDATVTGDERMKAEALLDAVERVGYKGKMLSFE